MQNPPVHYSDLLLLHNFFCGGQEASISDPGHRLLFEGRSPEFKKDATISLSSANSSTTRIYFGSDNWKEGRPFIYVNNPDGTIRWIMPAESHVPAHLALYNSGTLKARIYKTISKALFSAGKGSLLASGILYIERSLVEEMETKFNLTRNSYAIFTGTRGQTRKLVIADSRGKMASHFIKIPVSAESEKLIQNEISMLSELSKYDFTALSLPRISDPRIKAYAKLSNVKPAVVIPANKITELHIRALSELYSTNNERKIVNDSAAWNVIANNMEWLQKEHLLTNGLDEIKTRRIIHLLRKLYNSIPAAEIPVSVSHGDFTPWNMYCDDQRLYVYDWELASNGIPMLFDMFHFIIQSQVLVHRKGYREVQRQIKETLQEYNALRLVNKYSIDVNLHFKLYLLFTVSYYLRIYIGEKELLTQSHWMIDLWHDALQDVNEPIQ